MLFRSRLEKRGPLLASGLRVGERIGRGKVRVIHDPAERNLLQLGEVLVTDRTDPDWEPVMKRAAAVVTLSGGRTCHAAIVSRELGVPAVVGVTEATSLLHDGQEVTVSCAEGDEGFVYDGVAKFDVQDINLSNVPETRTKVMLNMANPAAALQWWQLPSDGIGLARM